MPKKRFIVEIGTGVVLHGGDMTKAAVRAVNDAVSRSCLCGLFEIAGLKSPDQMHVEVKIACPYPEKVDTQVVIKAVPVGKATVEAVTGGLTARGLYAPQFGEGDTIVVANAALTVYVEN